MVVILHPRYTSNRILTTRPEALLLLLLFLILLDSQKRTYSPGTDLGWWSRLARYLWFRGCILDKFSFPYHLNSGLESTSSLPSIFAFCAFSHPGTQSTGRPCDDRHLLNTVITMRERQFQGTSLFPSWSRPRRPRNGPSKGTNSQLTP